MSNHKMQSTELGSLKLRLKCNLQKGTGMRCERFEINWKIYSVNNQKMILRALLLILCMVNFLDNYYILFDEKS